MSAAAVRGFGSAMVRTRSLRHEQQSSEDTEQPPKGAHPKSFPRGRTFSPRRFASPSLWEGLGVGCSLGVGLLFHHVSSLQTARYAHSPRDGGQHRDEEFDYLFPVYFHGLSCFYLTKANRPCGATKACFLTKANRHCVPTKANRRAAESRVELVAELVEAARTMPRPAEEKNEVLNRPYGATQ